jgi:hypothetical protein
MPKALANRLCHIDVKGSNESWERWAVKNGINERVIGFIAFRPNYLMGFDAGNDDLAFATPRSWEMVSNILNLNGGDVKTSYSMIAGCIGTGTAVEFSSFCKLYDKLPRIDDIFAGRYFHVPTEPDVLHALVSSMTAYAREYKNDITKIANSISYAMGMPADFAAVLFKNYCSIEKGYKDFLLRIPEFYKWMSTKGAHFNGIF